MTLNQWSAWRTQLESHRSDIDAFINQNIETAANNANEDPDTEIDGLGSNPPGSPPPPPGS